MLNVFPRPSNKNKIILRDENEKVKCISKPSLKPEGTFPLKCEQTHSGRKEV